MSNTKFKEGDSVRIKNIEGRENLKDGWGFVTRILGRTSDSRSIYLVFLPEIPCFRDVKFSSDYGLSWVILEGEMEPLEQIPSSNQ